jgi:hypothetical protein
LIPRSHAERGNAAETLGVVSEARDAEHPEPAIPTRSVGTRKDMGLRGPRMLREFIIMEDFS